MLRQECQGARPGELGVFLVIASAGGIGEGVVGDVPVDLVLLAGAIHRRLEAAEEQAPESKLLAALRERLFGDAAQ